MTHVLGHQTREHPTHPCSAPSVLQWLATTAHQLAGVKIAAHLLFLRQATVLTSPPTIPHSQPIADRRNTQKAFRCHVPSLRRNPSSTIGPMMNGAISSQPSRSFMFRPFSKVACSDRWSRPVASVLP